MSRLFKTEGVILRVTPFQDHHLILTALTPERGKLALFARHARRARSPFGPEIDLLCRSELVLLEAKNVKPLREATLVEYYPQLKSNYDRLSSALSAARWLSRLVEEGQREPRSYALLLALLRVLNREQPLRTLETYALAFKLRLLDSFGVGPRLDGCVECNRKSPTFWFSLERGGVRCPRCAQVGDRKLAAGVVYSLNALRTLGWERLERLQLSTRTVRMGEELVERFMSYHVRPTSRRGSHPVTR